MRKLIFIAVLIAKSNSVFSQDINGHDSIRKHELSLGILPMINVFSGAFPRSVYTNFNFGYKRFFKNHFALRTAFVIFPNGVNRSFTEGLVFYHSTVGNKNVFYSQWLSATPRSQFNLGIEKIYRQNRLSHSIGVDAFVNHVRVTISDHYFFRYQNQSFVAPFTTDTTNYNVDSLGFVQKETRKGMGLQAFYCVRFKISKRFYLSATIGPSFNFSIVNGSRFENRTKETSPFNYFEFDFPHMGFISDIAICFRL